MSEHMDLFLKLKYFYIIDINNFEI